MARDGRDDAAENWLAVVGGAPGDEPGEEAADHHDGAEKIPERLKCPPVKRMSATIGKTTSR